MHVFRKRIEPESPVTRTSVPPSALLQDPTPIEEDGVRLASPTSAVPQPPLPEAQTEGDQTEQQQLEEQQEECQEEQQQQQQPLPPAGSEEMMTSTELTKDTSSGKIVNFIEPNSIC